ncbi:MAG: hypothetical protein M0024_01660 [Nitrospiraceae bacterium]|nr:hypothetical protein [Nitrospiraceae bacterium]
MKGNNIKRIIIVYVLLIPLMLVLTEAVWGGFHGIVAGKFFRDSNKLDEVKAFMKKHGISETATKSEGEEWLDNLSPEDRAEYEQLIKKAIKIEDIVTFGSALTVCVIVFGLIGLLGGAFTKSWQAVGILPGISFLLNNPVIRFKSVLHISDSQKVILVVVGQFVAAYLFAFLGSHICKAMNDRKQQKLSLNNSVHTDAG